MENIYKTSLLKSGLFLLALVCCSGLLRAQFITNGDFESWTGNCPLNVAPNSWTNYSTPGAAPDQAGTCAGTVTAHGGASYMNIGWINTGLMEGAVQTISGLTLGRTYRITFWGINSQGLYATPGDCMIQLHQNSISVFSTPNLVSGGAWTMYTYDFVGTSPSEVVGVRVVPGTSGTSGSAGVDDFQVTELVDVRDAMMHPITVWPSPTTDALYIDQGDYYTSDLQGVAYTVTNIVGQTMQESALNFANGKARLDLQGYRPGIYTLSMMVEGQKEVRKFMVK